MRSSADDARLAAAVKADDGFFATFFVSSYTPRMVRLAARLGLRPNQVTGGSLAVGLGAAASFAAGSRAGLIVGAVLLQVSFTLDVVDGQLARYTGAMSEFGGWFDGMVDRIKEYAVYAGLAIGSGRSFHDNVWALAGAALVMQTTRHHIDFCYAAGREAVRRDARRNASYWVRRIIVLPIGERLLLVSLTAAIFRPEVTFVALLSWGGLATAYTLAGRVRRAWANPAPPGAAAVLAVYRDDGIATPLLSWARLRPWYMRASPTGRLDFLVPPMLLVVETVGILALATSGSDHDLAAGFALAAVVVMHRYDLVYRGMRAPTYSSLELLCGGWGVRLLIAFALSAGGAVDPGFYVLAGALTALLCADQIQAWQDPGTSRESPAAGSEVGS